MTLLLSQNATSRRCAVSRPFSTVRVLALTIAILLSSISGEAYADGSTALVKTTLLETENAGLKRSFFGQMTAKQTVDLGFQVGGRIEHFNAPEGSVIPKGSVIARLDPIPFQMDVDRARLALEQAQRQVARFAALSGSTISTAQMQDAVTQMNLSEVDLRNAEYALEKSVLIAPFDAVVATRSVANFSTIAAGTQVVRLHDMSELRVDIEVPELLIQELGENPDVELTAHFPGVDTSYPLIFREVNAETSQVGQTFRVTLAIEVPESRLLLPGASVVVRARINGITEGTQVPASALAMDPSGATSVFVVTDKDGSLTVKKVAVHVGVSASGSFVLRDRSIAGAEVVVGGVNALSDGQAVRRFTEQF